MNRWLEKMICLAIYSFTRVYLPMYDDFTIPHNSPYFGTLSDLESEVDSANELGVIIHVYLSITMPIHVFC